MCRRLAWEVQIEFIVLKSGIFVLKQIVQLTANCVIGIVLKFVLFIHVLLFTLWGQMREKIYTDLYP